ncbi:hypothetical protein GCM10025859_25870 [Alicyclobacillus fastidiosus]|nr:hypothetical protein GCM10025859_25870 [Alicyclobacillus fastidiosus]
MKQIDVGGFGTRICPLGKFSRIADDFVVLQFKGATLTQRFNIFSSNSSGTFDNPLELNRYNVL